ncbi:MAG: hypothetical protein IKP54_11140, partial [Bacteroidales bacterium]|nr:hypothetical protein [Bacteroidales bacterium]
LRIRAHQERNVRLRAELVGVLICLSKFSSEKGHPSGCPFFMSFCGGIQTKRAAENSAALLSNALPNYRTSLRTLTR